MCPSGDFWNDARALSAMEFLLRSHDGRQYLQIVSDDSSSRFVAGGFNREQMLSSRPRQCHLAAACLSARENFSCPIDQIFLPPLQRQIDKRFGWLFLSHRQPGALELGSHRTDGRSSSQRRHPSTFSHQSLRWAKHPILHFLSHLLADECFCRWDASDRQSSVLRHFCLVPIRRCFARFPCPNFVRRRRSRGCDLANRRQRSHWHSHCSDSPAPPWALR